MIFQEMKRKHLKFGTVDVCVKVHEDNDLPKNESIMGLLTEMFGHPITKDVNLKVTYTIYEEFALVNLIVLAIKKGLSWNLSTEALDLIYMGTDGLEREGWTRVGCELANKFLSYSYVMVG